MKALKVVGKVLVCIALTLVLLLLVLRLGVTVMYFDFFNQAKSEFLIPGLSDNWVPQGFDYIEERNTYLMCGYMSDGTSSRVYIRDAEGITTHTNLLYADGTPYRKHAGGICHNGEYVYLAGDDGVDVFDLTDILDGGDARKLGKIVLGHDMAYCSFYNGYLLAGNFYHETTYETPEKHRITTPAGDANTALITIFQADPLAELGVDPVPVAAISTPGKIQGICFTAENEIVLSASYSVASSYLYYHNIDLERRGTVEACGQQVPLYYLDSATLTHTATLPPMSEELLFKDGRVWVLCESACNKYIYGKFIRGYQVYSYDHEV
jgi:hypothetical protein